MSENIFEILEKKGVKASGHFVYKEGTHGPEYVNKELFDELGAENLCNFIRQVGDNAISSGLDLKGYKEVGIIGPAYGAIPFSLVMAEHLEKKMPGVKFFPARTQLMPDEKTHYIPEKLLAKYRRKAFITFEDIVNNGKTCRGVKDIFINDANAAMLAIMCFVGRGGQTAKSLEVEQYYPLIDIIMPQYDPRKEECPLCKAGIPINTVLGKGKDWVKMFGQPSYPAGTDFSKYWG